MISCPKNLRLIQQDREQPETVDTHLSKVPFDAKFADEELNTTTFSEDPGSDGFMMNSAPLFEVREWKTYSRSCLDLLQDARFDSHISSPEFMAPKLTDSAYERAKGLWLWDYEMIIWRLLI